MVDRNTVNILGERIRADRDTQDAGQHTCFRTPPSPASISPKDDSDKKSPTKRHGLTSTLGGIRHEPRGFRKCSSQLSATAELSQSLSFLGSALNDFQVTWPGSAEAQIR